MASGPPLGMKTKLEGSGSVSEQEQLLRWFFGNGEDGVQLGLDVRVDVNAAALQRHHVVGTVIKVGNECKTLPTMDPPNAAQQEMIKVLLPHAQYCWEQPDRPGFGPVGLVSEQPPTPSTKSKPVWRWIFKNGASQNLQLGLDLRVDVNAAALQRHHVVGTVIKAGAECMMRDACNLSWDSQQCMIDALLPHAQHAWQQPGRPGFVARVDGQTSSEDGVSGAAALSNMLPTPLTHARGLLSFHGHFGDALHVASDDGTQDDVETQLLVAMAFRPDQLQQHHAAAGAPNAIAAASLELAKALFLLHGHVEVPQDAKLEFDASWTEARDVPPAEVCRRNANGGTGSASTVDGTTNSVRPLPVTAEMLMRLHDFDEVTINGVKVVADAQLLQAATVAPYEVFQSRGDRSAGDLHEEASSAELPITFELARTCSNEATEDLAAVDEVQALCTAA